MTVIEGNQELFREAVLVYEAVALEQQYRFRVERVWRGDAREVFELTWPVQRLDACEGHQPTVAGSRYLVTVQCRRPTQEDVFTCPSRAEPVEIAETRLRYLREATPLAPEELAQHLQLVIAGRLTLEDLAFWIGEMLEVAEVLDWQEPEDGRAWSLTLGSLRELDFQLNGRGVPLAELECELTYLTKTVLPLQVALLQREPLSVEDLELLEAAYEATDELCW